MTILCFLFSLIVQICSFPYCRIWFGPNKIPGDLILPRNIKINFKFFNYIYCVAYRSKDNLWEPVLSFNMWIPGIGLGGSHLSTLSAIPKVSFLLRKIFLFFIVSSFTLRNLAEKPVNLHPDWPPVSGHCLINTSVPGFICHSPSCKGE